MGVVDTLLLLLCSAGGATYVTMIVFQDEKK